MMVVFIVIIMVRLSCTYRAGHVPTSFPEEDDDVSAERRRLTSTPIAELVKTDSLMLVNLHKKFGGFVAVNHTCVGVQEQVAFPWSFRNIVFPKRACQGWRPGHHLKNCSNW
jgi:hypothetical protein